MKKAIDERTKELIAIGASIGAHCQPCLTYHVAKAKEIGIEENEIREAIAVGHMVEKGAMAAMREHEKVVLSATPPTRSACCRGKDSKNGKNCCG